jgi:hypothetical protein
MSRYYDALVRKIETASGKPFAIARHEWLVVDEWDLEDATGTCYCGYHGIRYEFSLMNSGQPGQVVTIGSKCQELFGREGDRARCRREVGAMAAALDAR